MRECMCTYFLPFNKAEAGRLAYDINEPPRHCCTSDSTQKSCVRAKKQECKQSARQLCFAVQCCGGVWVVRLHVDSRVQCFLAWCFVSRDICSKSRGFSTHPARRNKHTCTRFVRHTGKREKNLGRNGGGDPRQTCLACTHETKGMCVTDCVKVEGWFLCFIKWCRPASRAVGGTRRHHREDPRLKRKTCCSLELLKCSSFGLASLVVLPL